MHAFISVSYTHLVVLNSPGQSVSGIDERDAKRMNFADTITALTHTLMYLSLIHI